MCNDDDNCIPPDDDPLHVGEGGSYGNLFNNVHYRSNTNGFLISPNIQIYSN